MPRHAAALLAACLALAACGGEVPPSEQRIRAMLAEAETDVEGRDAGAVLEHVSERYHDAEGRDRQDLHRLIAYLILRNQQIHLLTRVQEVEILSPEGARARVLVAMAGHPIGGPELLTELRADLYRFDFTLALENDAWRVVDSAWERARSADFL